MKNIKAILLTVCLAVLHVACENSATLDETRVTDVAAPSVTLKSINLNKFNATFDISLDASGTPSAREYGVLVSTEAQPDLKNSTIITADITETQAVIEGSFAPGTTYYACAYALTANQIVTSEVKTFTTAPHYLGAFLGKRTLSGYNLHTEGVLPIQVEIVADEENEKVAYLKGLTSFAGVTLALEPVKMVFNIENGEVTIPGNQGVNEPKYGPYQYGTMDPETNNVFFDDNIGTIQNNVISFTSLIALIVDGQNAGLPHFCYFDFTIK